MSRRLAPDVVLAAVGLLSVVTQCAISPFAPLACAVLAPVHGLCCASILGMLHPMLSALLERLSALSAQRARIDTALLSMDPLVQAAMQLASPPPPWRMTLFALLVGSLADLAGGLFAWLHNPLRPLTVGWEPPREVASASASAYAFVPPPPTPTALGWACAHEALAAASVCLLIYATTGLGLSPSRLLRWSWWGVGAAGGMQLLLARPPLPADADWLVIGHSMFAACRTLGVCALGSQAAVALNGAMLSGQPTSVVEDSQTPCSAAASDITRWLLQVLGALLLLVRPVLAIQLPAGGDGLGVICERLSYACLTLSAYLCNFQPLPRDSDSDSDEPAGSRGYESLSQMREARRAARQRAQQAAAARPPPLMVDSWSRAGGVQGLRCHDAALRRDGDGDEAHDFWEEARGGGFRRAAAA